MRSADLAGWGRALVSAGTATAVGCLALTLDNARRIRIPDPADTALPEPLTVLVPMRDEIRHAEACVVSVLQAADRWPGELRIVVLDDGSSDGTADVLAGLAADDPRVQVIAGTAPPAGWLGKTWACQQLSEHALSSGVMVFLDADVRLEPHALVSSVALMRSAGLDLLCPYPRQIVGGFWERLVQPLLQWSWMSTLPLRVAERSSRPSLSAANGQLLVIDAEVYRAAGGHGAVRDVVLEDIALLRAVKAVGGRGVVVEGSAVAECRMYDGWRELRAGYRKSLWSAFGSPAGAAGVMVLLLVAYVVPASAAVRGSRAGMIGYVAGVASRIVVARRTSGRIWPDVLAHPLSVVVLAGLTADSVVAQRRGELQWKGRAVMSG